MCRLHRLFVSLSAATARRPRLALAAALALGLVCLVVASHLKIETDLAALLPRSSPAVRDLATTAQRFGAADTLVVVLRLRPEHEPEAVVEHAEVLTSSLRRSGLVAWAEYRAAPAAQLAEPLLDNALLFLTPAELEEVLASLAPEGLARTAAALHARVLSPEGAAAKEMLTQDPLGLLPRILAHLAGAQHDMAGFGRDGLLQDPRGEVQLILAKPARPATDLAAGRQLLAALAAAQAEAEQAWFEAGWAQPPPAMEAGGGPLAAVEDAAVIQADLLRGALTSLAGVTLLLFLTFRSPRLVVLAGAPLLLGIGATAALAAAARGHVTALAASFAALLLGLGVDFGIVVLGRYAAERASGASHGDSLATLGRQTTRSVLLGAATTAASFGVFGFTGFPGLVELGMLTGGGILLVAATTLLLLPALLSLGNLPPPARPRLAGGTGAWLVHISTRQPRLVLALSTALLATSALAALGVRYDEDFQRLRNPGGTSLRLQHEIGERFGARLAALVLRVDGADEVDAIGRAQALLPELFALRRAGVISRVETLAAWLPPVGDQWRAVRRLAEAGIDPEETTGALRAAMQRAGLASDAFAPGLAHLATALSVRAPMQPSTLAKGELAPLLERLISVTPAGASVAVYCYPAAGTSARAAIASLQALAGRTPGVVLTGPLVLSAELRRMVREQGAFAAALGLLGVALLLAAESRSCRDAALTLVPLAAGAVLMLGAMAAFDIPLDLVNAFALAMVGGIGVDYGIHILHRCREQGEGQAGLASTAEAVLVAAITTMVGFGSFAVSSFPGFRGLGLAVILGTAGSCVAALTLLPALLALLSPARDKS